MVKVNMNTIHEVQSIEELDNVDVKTPNSTQNSCGNNQHQSSENNTNNNHANCNATSPSTSNGISIEKPEANGDLKIMGHLKNIEKINEKRRIFLSNTVSEYSSSAEKFETKTSTTSSGGNKDDDNTVNTLSEERHIEHFSEEHFGSSSSSGTKPITSIVKYDTIKTVLKTPSTPPPKPPMLSRTKSLNTPPQSPAFVLKSPLPTANAATSTPPIFKMPTPTTLSNNTATTTSAVPPTFTTTTSVVPPTFTTTTTATVSTSPTPQTPSVVNTATVTSKIVPEPISVRVTTVKLNDEDTETKENTPQLRNAELHLSSERPMSVSVQSAASKQISINHYERLIEELKCPGCASPMKGPILLCKSGHSVCEQCTRILLMCPLCKETFTTMRSATVEALCRKAHFRCANAAGGCTVRLQIDLLGWHEKQCVYKPMKCFMGRVWGDCKWAGREIEWKEHLEAEHANKVFKIDSVDLIWNMGVKQKPLTGYYVFQAFGEMFNFYEVYDKDRVLFTMACTSTMKDKKHSYAFEVTMIHQDNEALAITQKFPVHSEYDKDILAEGTCVNISLNDLAKFIDEEKLLHYRVRIVEVKSLPRKLKNIRKSLPDLHPIDFQQTQIEGGNLKNVPPELIITHSDANNTENNGNGSSEFTSEEDIDKIRRLHKEKFTSSPSDSCSESDPEFDAFVARRWGTPQLHFQRKYLKNTNDKNFTSASVSEASKETDNAKVDSKLQTDDKISVTSTSTNYKKRMTSSLRRSFRALKTDLIDINPFAKKSSEKNNK